MMTIDMLRRTPVPADVATACTAIDDDAVVDVWEAVSLSVQLSCAQTPEAHVPILAYTTSSDAPEWVVTIVDEDGDLVWRRVPRRCAALLSQA